MISSKAPRISIVTPSFNQGSFIEEAIESVLMQGYMNVEHIIVDNCSTDITATVLAKYPHLRVIREPDKGQSDALNKGFKVAGGDIVGWLNADDKYAAGCFMKIAEGFNENPSADIIYGDYRLIDFRGDLIRVRKELDFDMFMLKYLHILYIPSTTTFFKRRIFDEGNSLDIGYHYAMDYEFFVRLALKGYRFSHVAQVLADFRWHEEAKSQKQTGRQKEEMARALFAQDRFLSGQKEPIRSFVRNVFMASARVKRCVLKAMIGVYGR